MGRWAQDAAPPRDAWEALQRCLRMPLRWVVLLTIAALLSTIRLEHAAHQFVWSFQVTTITAVLLALAWLPALLSVIALTGGNIKTSAGEASTGGLLGFFQGLPKEQREASLSALAAVAGTVEATGPTAQRPQARQIREEAEDAIASTAGDKEIVERRLTELAGSYESTRKSMPPGPTRTRAMTEIVATARAYAKGASVVPQRFFRTDDDGSRLIGLAIVQAVPDRQALPNVLDAITNPRSAFEQFNALRAADALLPLLNTAELDQLRTAITSQIVDRETATQHITPNDPSRYGYAHDLIRQIAHLSRR